MYIVMLGWRVGELSNTSNYGVTALTLSDRKSSLSLRDDGYNFVDWSAKNVKIYR